MEKHKILSITTGQTALVIDKTGGFDIVGFEKDDSLLFVMLASFLLETVEYFDLVKEALANNQEYIDNFNDKVNLSGGSDIEDLNKHNNS